MPAFVRLSQSTIKTNLNLTDMAYHTRFIYFIIETINKRLSLPSDDIKQLEIPLFWSSIIILINLGMKGSSLTENHLLRVNIGFHSVNLIAKFSCDIVLTLKTHDNKLICQTVPKSLLQGRCDVNQQLQLEWQSAYDVGKSEYLQTSMEITVLVNSINGTIQAGLCTIDVTRLMKQSNIPIKKCSDKSASICITSSFEFLQVVQQKDYLQSSKESYPSNNNSIKHQLNKMRSMEFLPKNQDSNLSISKIAISNKRLEGYLRGENEQLQRQIDIVEGKLKVAERNQKELIQQLRQSNNKYDKLNMKYIEQASSYDDMQLALQEKDKIIRYLQSDLKKNEAKLKEMSEQQQNWEKKYQIKQHALQEQVRRLNEKAANFQSQLRESAEYQNTLLAKFELNEKSAQVLIKEREKGLIADKNKLIKEKSDLQNLNEGLFREVKDLKQRITEMQYIHQKQREVLDSHTIIRQKDEEIDRINQQYIKAKQLLKEKQNEVEELLQSNESRQSIRKRANELQTQNNSLKMQFQKANQLLVFGETKTKELSQKLQQLQLQKRKYQTKFQQALSNKSIHFTKCNQLEKQIDYYQDSYQKLAELLSQTKQKKDQIEVRLKQQLEEWTRHTEILSVQKSQLQSENVDMKWELERLQARLKESEESANRYKSESFTLKQQLLLKSQNFGQFQLTQRQLEQTINRLTTDLELSENRIKDLLKSNTEKATLNVVFNKEKQKLFYEIESIKNEHLSEINQIKAERLSNDLHTQNLQKQIEDKNAQLQRLSEQLSKKQAEIQTQVMQVVAKQKDLQGVLQENQCLSEQNVRYTCDLTHKSSQIKSLKEERTLLGQQCQKWKSEANYLRQQNQFISTHFDQYKTSNNDAARWVLCLLGQEELIIDKQTVFFPEENLRELQVEAINNRNLFLGKLKQTMKAITQQKQFLTFQLEKIGQQQIETQNEYEDLLEGQRNERQNSIKQLLIQRNGLVTDLQSHKALIEELKASNDNYFKQNRLYQHQINELQQEKRLLSLDNEQLEAKNKQIQQQTFQKSQKLIYSQKEIEQNYQILAEERKLFTQQQQKEKKKYEEQINLLESKLKLRQEEALLKNDKIRNLEEKCLILQSDKRKAEFSLTILEQLSKQRQKKLEEAIQLKTQQQATIETLRAQIDRRQKQIQQKQVSVAQLANQINQVEQKYSELLLELHAAMEVAKKQEAGISSKAQQCKQLKAKLKQAEDHYSRNRELLQMEVAKKKGQMDISDMMIQRLKQQAQQKTAQVDALHQQLQEKRQYISRLESDNEMVHKEVYFQQSHKTSLQRQFEELTENYEQAKSDIYLLEEEKLKLLREISALKEQIEDDQKRIEREMQNSRMRVAKEVADLKKKLQLQDSKLHKMEAKCQELKLTIRQLQSINDKKEFLILASEQQKQKLRCDFQEQIERLNCKLERLHERHQEAINDYRQQREQLVRQIEHLNHQCTQYNELIRKKEEELEDNLQEHDSSLRKIALLQSEMKQMQNDKSPKPEKSAPCSLEFIPDEEHQQKQTNGNPKP